MKDYTRVPRYNPYPAVGSATMGSDAAPDVLTVKARNAWAQATTNTTGANLRLGAGIGRRIITVVDYSLIDATIDTITITINGTANVGTEGTQDATHWKAQTSNAVTATNIATWANGLTGISASASGAVVYITPAVGTYSVTLATSMDSGEGTVTSGTDGDMIANANAFHGFPVELVVACSDETTAITAGNAKVTFRMPFAMTVSAVRGSLSTAQPSGAQIFTVDINEGGTSILSTKLTIDNTETTSTTAATPPVLSDTALADDAQMTVDVDAIGDSGAKGLKITLIGTRT